jgi:hypothetical protein
MKLHRACDVSPDGSGRVCRQSRLGGILMLFVFGGACWAAPVFIFIKGGPTWIGVPLALFALLLTPFLVGDALARFRRSNWLLWVRPDGLWIHLRSYRDGSPGDTPSVVELSYGEILEVRKHTERYTVPHGNKTVTHTTHSLEISLREPDTGELAAAIAECRRLKQPERTYLGFIRSPTNLTHFPVSLPAADVIRVAWSGQNHGVAPSLRRTLAALEGRVAIAEPQRLERKPWQELTDTEIDDLVLEFVRRGDRMNAMNLLVDRRDYSLTQAAQFVGELDGRA